MLFTESYQPNFNLMKHLQKWNDHKMQYNMQFHFIYLFFTFLYIS